VLRFDDAEEVLVGLLRALGARSQHERRSAALALGGLETSHALAPLMTAFEVERDALTRAFLLLAIGRQGGQGDDDGPDARDFLVRNLSKGPSATRPWTAFALGILARETNDVEARAALREGFDREANRGTRGAFLLALGIARDAGAGAIAREEMIESKSAVARMHAGLALALTEDPEAGPALRRAIEVDASPMARFAFAQGLGRIGATEDVPRLVSLLESVGDPGGQGQLAVAIAFHGTAAAVRALIEVLDQEKLPASGHAAAIQALGMLLSREAPFRFAALSEGMNHTLLPDWAMEALVSSL
jgi:HEAT repeat protein